MGDINIHNEDENDIKVVTIPTHQDGHTLDHLLIPKDCNVEFT